MGHSKVTAMYYDVTLPGCKVPNDDAVKAYAANFVFSEAEKSEQTLAYMDYKDTVNGIDIYYCFGSDNYHFADSDE